MIFNSVTFLIFLPVVVILYWLFPRRARLMMIFSSSLFFYGCWRFEYIPIMLISVFIDYFASRRLEIVDKPATRRLILALSLSANLGLLAYFKYTMFAVENLNSLAGFLGSDARFSVHAILLPLGISFYTFQSISYTIDVYRRNLAAQRDFLLFANYVVFFPQLIAGPILRASEVMWQLDNRPDFKLGNLEAGTRAILAGLFLKVVLADNIAPLVDMGYAHNPEVLGAIDVWTLAFLFGFQIYFDFAAYSQVAIGSARLMGIHFPQNFNFPYLACSPKDFWRRWHISLSSWVRDYLYLPLCSVPVGTTSTGGLSVTTQTRNPVSDRRRTTALFVSWALMGLWHGPAWAFVLWGVWHAVMVYGYRSISPLIALREPLRTVFGWLCTIPVAMLAWIPFRAVDLGDTLTMLGKLIQPSQYFDAEMAAHGHLPSAIPHSLDPATYYAMLLMLILMFGAAAARRWVFPAVQEMPWAMFPGRVLAFAVMTVGVFIYLRPIRQFIYFQF